MTAYDADYVTRDGRLVIDDPGVRSRLIEAIDAYTVVYRKGCTPPELDRLGLQSSTTTSSSTAEAVVIVLNDTLSIPSALKRDRPEDDYKNTATIEWPLGPDGEAFPILGDFWGAVVLKDGRNVDDRQGIRALSRGRGLACPLSRLRGRALPAADAEAAGRRRSGSIRAIRTVWPR